MGLTSQSQTTYAMEAALEWDAVTLFSTALSCLLSLALLVWGTRRWVALLAPPPFVVAAEEVEKEGGVGGCCKGGGEACCKNSTGAWPGQPSFISAHAETASQAGSRTGRPRRRL